MKYTAQVRVVVHGLLFYNIDAENQEHAREIAMDRAGSGDWSMQDLEILDCDYPNNSDTRVLEDEHA